jgi:asparagine synthetase B (glutamine-hydrolysing)
VELRLPFLERGVVEVALRLPAESLVAGDVGKRALRDALRGRLRDEIVDARKRPGLAPARPPPQARRAWRELLGDWLVPARVLDALPADPRAVTALLADRDRSGAEAVGAEAADAVLMRLVSLVILCQAARGPAGPA